ncbi:type II toxin-antitoxin system PemK/MazF family toxin [Aliirhizobium terrae]|uniref:type II toxin-antitoxin system PemK/MazF family toxin n=1 Tax=Terrirhizobium terrae TaxID=2926709 RepID=UPI0025789829|nr:type II toxin-antitoxin system PemK/MazF family toxin [Rhizobium sp. CC-CFT758]WJH40873.1 type II toxin-antitoxin system PemK/MazF family toxin [Rhizobium sp. CC-CFT758]
MRRGDLVTVAMSGDYGKLRPAVIVTSDILLTNNSAAVVVCQLTSVVDETAGFRVAVAPTSENGLKHRSDIMADKPIAVSRRRIGYTIGRLSDEDVQRLDVALAFALGLSD